MKFVFIIIIQMIQELSKKLISNNPTIYTIDDFITQEHCQHFINISKVPPV